MTLITNIKDAVKTAMKAKDKDTLTVLRSLQAAIKQIEIDKQITLDDAGVLDVIQKQIKQRQESLKIYTENQRTDLAEKEQKELDVLGGFMPEPMTEAELTTLVAEEISLQGASSMKDMGKVMNALKTKTAGKADPAAISKLVKAALA